MKWKEVMKLRKESMGVNYGVPPKVDGRYDERRKNRLGLDKRNSK